MRACLPSLLHAWETKPFSTVALLHALKILNLTQKNRMEQVFSAFGQKLGSTFGFDLSTDEGGGAGAKLELVAVIVLNVSAGLFWHFLNVLKRERDKPTPSYVATIPVAMKLRCPIFWSSFYSFKLFCFHLIPIWMEL